MADQENAKALFLQLSDQLRDHRRFVRIKGGGGVIHDEDFGVEIHSPRNGRGLMLAPDRARQTLSACGGWGSGGRMILRVSASIRQVPADIAPDQQAAKGNDKGRNGLIADQPALGGANGGAQ